MAEQRTSDWLTQRVGKFTSSEIYKLMVEPRSKEAKDNGELSETAKTYVKTKIAEEVGFVPDFVSEATTWGVEQEYNARKWYHRLTRHIVEEVGFIEHPVHSYYGGSPDGKVIDAEKNIGALEIKCPWNSTHHLDHCLIDSQEYFKKTFPEYYWQCVSHMVILGTQWCDFVSYDGRIDKEIGLFIFRVERKQQEIDFILSQVEKANSYKQELKLRLQLT